MLSAHVVTLSLLAACSSFRHVAAQQQASVRRVRTIDELEVAITRGFPHIVLTEHLDAWSVNTVCTSGPCFRGTTTTFTAQLGLRSIRVRMTDSSTVPGIALTGCSLERDMLQGECSTPVSFPGNDYPLTPPLYNSTKPGQCGILTDRTLIQFLGFEQQA
jgi:hypothetical protein